MSEGIASRNLRLGDLLGALSHALDLTEGQPEGHCERAAYIGVLVGREMGLDEPTLADLYYTILLKDLGCSSNAARICQLYLTDDLTFKADFKHIDGSLPQALRFVLAHTGLKAGLAERFRALINIVQNGGRIAHDLIETRCQRGADIARRMRFSDAVAAGIASLDERWNGAGLPEGLKGELIPLNARIALLAQVVDVFHLGSGREAAIREVSHRAGTWFDPAIAAAFRRVAERPDFWTDLSSPNLPGLMATVQPAEAVIFVDEDYLDDIAASFAQVIDAKSPYTSGHSERVTLFADMIAAQLDFSPEKRRWLKRAALLHDIGKLGVSNAILDKPAKLDEQEWAQMRQHAAFSERILARVEAFRDLAPIAGAHHEKLDGTGYPKGLNGDAISFDTRIITTADIFDALTAKRPYRDAMPVSKALSIMAEMVGAALDPTCFEALRAALAKFNDRISDDKIGA